MKKNKGFILSTIIFIVGFIVNGLAWTISSGPYLNTAALILGVLLMFAAFVLFIYSFSLKD